MLYIVRLFPSDLAMQRFPQADYFHSRAAKDTPPVFLLPYKRMVLEVKKPSHGSSYRNAIKRSAISQKPFYKGMHLLENLPPSPFFQIQYLPPPSPFEDTEDGRINQRNNQMFTREVKKDVKNGAEEDYYNQWIMSNVG